MTNKNIIIKKSTGEEEEFSENKFCLSLKESGAPEDLTKQVCEIVSKEIEPGMSTNDIFRKASQHLARANTKIASRYNLKRGMASLGPAGFLFEQFVEAVAGALGYETERNVFMQGKCLEHEVDVIARKENEHFLIEAKYRNSPGGKTAVDVVMYAHARLQDIAPAREHEEGNGAQHGMWLITNTKFTSHSKKYARCHNIKLTGWRYPVEESLEDIITKHSLYPVTVLPSIDNDALHAFARHNMMLARDLAPYSKENLVKDFGLSGEQASRIIHEVHELVYGEERKQESAQDLSMQK